jgi:hypothetical protein
LVKPSNSFGKLILSLSRLEREPVLAGKSFHIRQNRFQESCGRHFVTVAAKVTGPSLIFAIILPLDAVQDFPRSHERSSMDFLDGLVQEFV